MSYAAADLGRLMNARLPGCICRRIEDEHYSRLVYEKTCTHHSSLFHQEKSLEEGYAKAEKVLKDEPRMRVIIAALTGAALTNLGTDQVEHKVRSRDASTTLSPSPTKWCANSWRRS